MSLAVIILVDLAVVYFFLGNSLLKWFNTPRGRRRLALREFAKSLKGLLLRDRDILEPRHVDGLRNALAEIQDGLKRGDDKLVDSLYSKYSRSNVKGLPPAKSAPKVRMHLETLVVALGVAFGIRSLFIQPFKIPTGSMQPTLYGIHFAGTEDAPSMNWVSRFFSYWNLGRSAVDIVAEEDGHLDFTTMRPSSRNTMFLPETEFAIGDRVYRFPGTVSQTRTMIDDYQTKKAQRGPVKMAKGVLLLQYIDYAGRMRFIDVKNDGLLDWSTMTTARDDAGRTVTSLKIGDDAYSFDLEPEDVKKMVIRYHLHAQGHGYDFAKGDVVVRGYAETGDHLFVNRVGLIFHEPHRGDPMVFQTAGLVSTDGRPFGGSYYIKRLVGMPGDTLKIVDHRLYVRERGGKEFKLMDGTVHPGFGRMYSMQGGYRGYSHMTPNARLGLSGGDAAYLKNNEDEFTVPDNEYFMMGDNSENSWDSRWFGSVPRANLMGSPNWVWWPLSRRWGIPDRCEPDPAIGATPPTMPVIAK